VGDDDRAVCQHARADRQRPARTLFRIKTAFYYLKRLSIMAFYYLKRPSIIQNGLLLFSTAFYNIKTAFYYGDWRGEVRDDDRAVRQDARADRQRPARTLFRIKRPSSIKTAFY